MIDEQFPFSFEKLRKLGMESLIAGSFLVVWLATVFETVLCEGFTCRMCFVQDTRDFSRAFRATSKVPHY